MDRSMSRTNRTVIRVCSYSEAEWLSKSLLCTDKRPKYFPNDESLSGYSYESNPGEVLFVGPSVSEVQLYSRAMQSVKTISNAWFMYG